MSAPRINDLTIAPVSSTAPLELRQSVLRPMQSIPECVYPGDDHPDALHLGATVDGVLIGVVSIFPEAGPSGIPLPSYRLRGMSVAPAWQGQGIGRLLLQGVDAWLDERHFPGVLWCNARTTAGQFYARMGWELVGEPFELPLIGEHVVMLNRLGTLAK